MTNKWFYTPAGRAGRSLDIVRITVALLLLVHSAYRIILGDVPGFGQYLGSAGYPLGVALAWLITLVTLAASIAMIVQRLVVPACISHMVVLVVGIIMIHASAGWFVVGGGRNGMEYSILLIACLFAVMLAYWPRKQ